MKHFKNASRCAMALTLALIGSTAVLAGCEEGETREEYSGMIVSKANSYIVISENDIETLHIGDVKYKAQVAPNRGYSLSPVLFFDCGESAETFQFVAYDELPSREKYDRVCYCANVSDEDLEL